VSKFKKQSMTCSRSVHATPVELPSSKVSTPISIFRIFRFVSEKKRRDNYKSADSTLFIPKIRAQEFHELCNVYVQLSCTQEGAVNSADWMFTVLRGRTGFPSRRAHNRRALLSGMMVIILMMMMSQLLIY